MATSRKTATAAAASRAVTKRTVKEDAVSAPEPVSVAAALSVAEVKCCSLAADLAQLTEDGIGGGRVVGQDMAQNLHALLVFETRLKKLVKEVKEGLLAGKANGVAFEPGRFAVLFDTTYKSSPKWKEEAVRLARSLAALKGEAFDEESWATSIAASYPKLPSTSVEIAISG